MNAKLITRLGVFAIAGAVLAGCSAMHSAEKAVDAAWDDVTGNAASSADAAGKGADAAGNAVADGAGGASADAGGTAGAFAKDIRDLFGSTGGPTGMMVNPRPDGSVMLGLGQAATFAESSARLRPEIYPLLEKLAGYLKGHPQVAVRACGFTDRTGKLRVNERLSRERARAALHFLKRRDIPSSQLLANGGCGANEFADSNEPGEEGRGSRSVGLVLYPNASAAASSAASE